MSEAEVERLSRLESVDHQQAEEALDRSEGDFERARSLLRKAPVAVKFRFSSQEEDVYGLGVILLEVAPPELRDLTVLVGNDQSLGTIGLSQKYSELKKLIAERSNESSTMAALSRRLREGLNDSLSPPSEDWVSLIKARNESDLQLLFEEHVKNLLDQEDLVLTADLEVGLFDPDLSENEEDRSTPDSPSPSPQESRQVELICDVKVSPVKGKAVQSLRSGDVIFVDVSESQNDDAALIEVIDQLRDDEVGLIPAKIDRLSRTETGKVEITVQFGETIVGEEMNILTPDSISDIGSSVEGLFSFLPWILVGLALLMIGIIFLWMLVFPL